MKMNNVCALATELLCKKQNGEKLHHNSDPSAAGSNHCVSHQRKATKRTKIVFLFQASLNAMLWIAFKQCIIDHDLEVTIHSLFR